jgi:hypothetical protein
MNYIDSHFEAIAEQAYATAAALDRFCVEETADEEGQIKARLANADATETTLIADEFQGGATTVPAIVAAWAKKDTAEVLRLFDEAIRAAIHDVATFRAEQIKP